jgi:hypothetical protein
MILSIEIHFVVYKFDQDEDLVRELIYRLIRPAFNDLMVKAVPFGVSPEQCLWKIGPFSTSMPKSATKKIILFMERCGFHG